MAEVKHFLPLNNITQGNLEHVERCGRAKSRGRDPQHAPALESRGVVFLHIV